MHSHLVMLEKDFQLIEGKYSLFLVMLSILLAVIASYTALTMNERAKNYSFFPSYLWQLFASISLAFGIWSLHYMGMLSFALPIEINYDLTLTIVSVIPSLIASFVIFYYINKSNVTVVTALLLSAVIAGGVASMHYAGMASIEVNALHKSNFYLVTVSVLIMFTISFLLISMNKKLNKIYWRAFFASLLGISIAVVHYGCMNAMDFYVRKGTVVDDQYLFVEDVRSLAIGLASGVFALVCLLLVASACDRYIEYRAKNYDVLTELPNSTALTKILKTERITQLAIWQFEDYDFINTAYGYEVGDEFIKVVLKKLRTMWPHKKRLYRIEKNRFAVLSMEKPQIFKEQLKKVQLAFDEPFQLQNEVVLARTICALSNENFKMISPHLLEQALAVLNTPKIFVSGQLIEYKMELHNKSVETTITQDVQSAMKNGDMYIVYQPKVGAYCRKVIGAEALLRWHHPTLGFLSPAVFIPILESTDQIRLVTDWIIQEVAKQKSVWNVAGLNIDNISINIPASYLTSKHLIKLLEAAVTKHKIAPSELDLEITETTFVRNIEEAMRAVMTIREKGYKVSLDDFGTGLSSLSYLKQMSISTLKIDKSFIDGIPHSLRDCSILRSLFVLCESLHLGIVIEGVETEQQLQYITSISNTAIIQGYYFSPPLQHNEFVQWLKQFEKNNLHNLVNVH